MRTTEVRVWQIQVNKYAESKRKTYTARWAVKGKQHSKTFATRALADNLRSKLMQAMNRGEEFDTESGLPARWWRRRRRRRSTRSRWRTCR